MLPKHGEDEKFSDSQRSPADTQFVEVDSPTSFRLPPLWTARPALSFVRIEAQLESNRIVKDDAMFDKVVREMDLKILSQVADILESPPPFDKYASNKQRINSAYAVSEGVEIRELLRKLEPGDETPSQMLRAMILKGANKVSLFLTSVQAILSISKATDRACRRWKIGFYIEVQEQFRG